MFGYLGKKNFLLVKLAKRRQYLFFSRFVGVQMDPCISESINWADWIKYAPRREEKGRARESTVSCQFDQ
jgi:hypothetical protein